MIDIIIEEIIDYIKEDLGNEKRYLNNLANYINFDLKRLYPLRRKKYHEALSRDIVMYRDLIDQIKKIREIYQKGYPFVRNITKGEKKLFARNNMRLSTIKFCLSHDKKDEALELAKLDADYIRKYNSERSYYRFKKELKKLGLEI